MSRIWALREREPRPVCVLVFRIEGLQGIAPARCRESANMVRREAAVRLRAGVRASDVVASLGADVFAVVLPSTEFPADAQRAVDKLLQALREPFKVAGSTVQDILTVPAAALPATTSLLTLVDGKIVLGAPTMAEAGQPK